MEDEKRISVKDVIKVLLGNKYLYLIMACVLFVASFVGLSIYSNSRVEYVAFFDYDVAGFTTKTSESGEVNSYYIDGEKFDPRALVTKEKLATYFSSREELKGLDVESLTNNNLVVYFDYVTRYVKNDHKMNKDDNEYIAGKKGFELVLNSSGLNSNQAKALSECIANEVLNVTEKKIDIMQYNIYLDSYDGARSYPDKINYLSTGIDYLNSLSDSLKSKYGDVSLPSGKYGGDEDKYTLNVETLSEWQKEMKIKFDTYYVSSIANELEINGFIFSDCEEYISTLKTAIDRLEREITVNVNVLNDLKKQRNDLVGSIGSGATVESVEIREYNAEIIALSKEIAKQTEQVDIYNLQLGKVDTSSFTQEQLDEYNAKLNSFNRKLSNIRDDLEFYTKQYQAISKKIMRSNSYVYYDNDGIVVSRGELGLLKIGGISLAVGLFGPMLLNLAIVVFNMAEGKPLFARKQK